MGVVQKKDHLRVRMKQQKDTRTHPLMSRAVGGETGMLKMKIAAARPLLSRVNIVHCLTDEILIIML